MIEVRHDGTKAVDERLQGSPTIRLITYAELEPRRPELIEDGGVAMRDTAKSAWAQRTPMFQFVALETRTDCNLSCSFCPVAKGRDPRPTVEMSLATIIRVAEELGSIGYQGTLLLFCNNEPLLDARIVDIVSLCRRHCPSSRIKILTNGTRLSVSLAHDLFDAGLSVLEIDNYTDSGRLIKPVSTLVQNADDFAHRNIRINMRRLTQVLTNRAGTAPNAPALPEPLSKFCALPFTDINVVPDGRVTLCCFDAHEQTDMGNVWDRSLVEIWSGEAFARVRDELSNFDRTGSALCAVCDYDGFRNPEPNQWL